MNTIIDTTTTQTMPYSGIGIATKKIAEALVRNNPATTYHLILHTEAESTLDPQVLNAKNVILNHTGKMPPGYLDPLTYTFHLRPVINYIYKDYPDAVYFATYFWHGHPAGKHPTVAMIYDFAMPYLNSYANKGTIINFLRKKEYWYWQNRTAKADAIIAISDSTADDYRKYYPDYPKKQIYKAYMGVELEQGRKKSVDADNILAKYLPADWKKRKYLIYMGGNIQQTKNNEGVIESYALFLKRLKKKSRGKSNAPYLVIAGAAYEKESTPVARFKKMIADMGLEKDVIFTGYYPAEHKEILLQNAFAFTHLSHYEGFGLSVAEAMRAGIPVVVSRTSSHPEVVGDSGILVNGNDHAKVADGYYKLYTDPKFATELGEKGQRYSRRFTWNECANEVQRVLELVGGASDQATR